MNQGKKGFALLTKWVFETNGGPEFPSMMSTSDVTDKESTEELDPGVGPYMDSINTLDIGSPDRLWKRDRFEHEEDCVGGWIVETQERMKNELDLFDPDAPSKERIARSYRLHRMPHLLCL